MSWDGAIHGRINVPAERRDAWLATALDWSSVEGHEAWDAQIDQETVADVLDELAFTDDMEFLELEWLGDELRVASFQSKDGFNETAIPLAAAWAAAAAHGGVGELVAMGMLTASFGYRLVVKGGKKAAKKK